MTVISYPIPAWSNAPINANYYQPSQFFISTITRGRTTIVTATADLNYVIGQAIRFVIPPQFGIRQLNERQGIVVSLPSSTQAEIDIDSTFMDPFKTSSASTQPQIMAIGDVRTGFISSTGRSRTPIGNDTLTEVPGSFINISPFR